MIVAELLTLSTSAELICNPDATADLPVTVTLKGGSADDIYIGGSAVDSTDGYPIGADTLTLVLGPGDQLWAVAGSGTPTINILRTRANAAGVS